MCFILPKRKFYVLQSRPLFALSLALNIKGPKALLMFCYIILMSLLKCPAKNICFFKEISLIF